MDIKAASYAWRRASSSVRRSERIDRTLQDVSGGHLVDQLGAPGPAGVGVEEGSSHRLGRPAFVPEQDRKAERLEVPGEGSDRLGSRRIASVEVERQADDETRDPLRLGQRPEPLQILAELASMEELGTE